MLPLFVPSISINGGLASVLRGWQQTNVIPQVGVRRFSQPSRACVTSYKGSVKWPETRVIAILAGH